jgi:parallel beta-helix repeat protein
MVIKKIQSICIIATCVMLLCAGSVYSANYYVSSSSGNDTNNGLSSSTPWQTLAKLQTVTLAPGDVVSLKRGDAWRGAITVNSSGAATAVTNAGSAANGGEIVFTSWGSGNNPVLNGTVIVTGWTASRSGVYAYPYPSTCTAIFEDGMPLKKASSAALTNGNWFSNGATIYYKPTTGLPQNHLVERSSLAALIYMNAKHDIVIDGLAVYGGTIGVRIIDGYNITVTNCNVFASGYVGISLGRNVLDARADSVTLSNNTISYCGNGIYIMCKQAANWSTGYTDVVVLNNTISFTDYQGLWANMTQDGNPIGIQNSSQCRFEGNTITNSYAGIALWTAVGYTSNNNRFLRNYISNTSRYGIAQGGDGAGNNSVGNVWAYNIIANCGQSPGTWGGLRINKSQFPPNYFVNNTLYNNDVNIYLYSTPDYDVIENNISLSPVNYHVLAAVGTGTHNTLNNNCYFSTQANRFAYLGSTALSFQQWKTKTGQDSASLFTNPLLVSATPENPGHFRLQTTSPSIGKGLSVGQALGLTLDVFGNPIATPPSIGAADVTSS